MAPNGATKAGAGRPSAAPRIVPPWFTANRVHGHTRLTLRLWHDTPESAEAAARFKEFGARVFARHTKTGGEDPWWGHGEPPPPNAVQQFIDSAHAQGLRILAYHWHMSQRSLEGEPGWVCKRENGRPFVAANPRKGYFLDMTGPYREVVLQRLRELAAMGADGLFFDFRHLPPRGCWHSALAAAWEARTGQPPPSLDIADPAYREFLDFKAEQIEQAFTYWRDQVKADYPHVLFIISSTTVPALTDREMTTRLAQIADSSKNEYHHALNPRMNKGVFDTPAMKKPDDHVRMALGWTVLRDASEGRPPHIWAGGVPNREHAQAYAASLLTFGCIANMDVHEHDLVEGGTPSPEWKTQVDALRAAFALGNAVSPHLGGAVPLRWAAIHFSERIRNERGHDFPMAWREVLWPLVGAYQAFTEAGVPVGIVNDWQLEAGALDGYRVLVLPNPGEVTAGQQQAIDAFRADGGAVLENDPAWPWSDPEQHRAAAAAFAAMIRHRVRVAPVRVTGGPTGRYGVAYRWGRKLAVAVTNDFSWVQIRWTSTTINPAPRPAVGVRVTWRRSVLPQRPQGGQLKAIEAVTGRTLDIEESGRTFEVRLPAFPFMALLVVTREVGR